MVGSCGVSRDLGLCSFGSYAERVRVRLPADRGDRRLFARQGIVIERRFGCTFYFYETPGLVD